MYRRRIAIGLGALGVLLGAGLVGLNVLGKELRPVGVGVRAPAFSAWTLDSVPRQRSLEEFRGQVIMINIWATWCAPCRVEMPGIEELHRAYAPQGLKVLAVSVDDHGMEQGIREFADQYGLTFEILHDPQGDITRIYQTTGYPETIIIGRDGIIRRKLLGAHNWNSETNRALIQRLLAEDSA